MSLEDDIKRLQRVDSLGALDGEALGLLAFASRKQRLRAGDRLFDAGDTIEAAHVIVSGEVDLAADGLAPRRVGAEATLCELSLFAPLEASSSARAASDVVVMRVARETMQRVLDEFPIAAAATRARVAAQLARFAQDAQKADVA